MKKYVMLFTSLGLLYSIGLAAHQVNAEETNTSTSTSDIAPRDIRVITYGEMTATGAINGLKLQGNNTVTTGQIEFKYSGFTIGAGLDDNTDFVFSVPDELVPLVNSKDFKQYISGEIKVWEFIPLMNHTYEPNDITIDDEGHSIRFRNPAFTYGGGNSVEVNLTFDLGQAVTDTGIRIPDAENNTTYDFNGGVIGRDELIDWGIIGNNNAPFSLPTYQLDPGWDLIQQIPTIEPVTDKDTSVKGRGYPGAAIQIKVGDTVIATGTVDSNGIYDIPIDPQAANVTLWVTQNTGVGWSEAATTVVTHEGEKIPAPDVNDVTTESDSVTGKGHTPGNTIIVKVQGQTNPLATALVQPDGSFIVPIPRQSEYTILLVTESNGTEESDPTTVVVKAGTPVQENKITHLDTYSISNSGGWVKGTYEGANVTQMRLVVNGQPEKAVPVVNNTIQYWAGNLITSTTQTVQVQILDASGTPLDTQPLTITA